MPGLLLLLLTAAILVVVVLTIVVVHDATHPVRRSGAYAAVRGLPFDPGDLDLKYEAWVLERPGFQGVPGFPGVPGAKLPVWEVELEPREDGKRPTAVFLHGWGESRIDMLKDIESWRGLVDRAVFYDLRGHGEASPGPSRLGNREDEDLLALLERLDGEKRFLLIGRDLGANIAMTAAAKAGGLRDRIAGVIAIAAYEDFHARLRQRLQRRGYPVWPMTNLAMRWLAATGRRPLVVGDDFEKSVECPMLRLGEWDEDRARGFVASVK